MIRRVVEAWRVLMGQRLTPLQIQREWLEYKMMFQDLMERWSAMLARQAKMEKRRLERLQEDPDQQKPVAADSKAALRRHYADLRGLGKYRQQLELKTHDQEDVEA